MASPTGCLSCTDFSELFKVIVVSMTITSYNNTFNNNNLHLWSIKASTVKVYFIQSTISTIFLSNHFEGCMRTALMSANSAVRVIIEKLSSNKVVRMRLTAYQSRNEINGFPSKSKLSILITWSHIISTFTTKTTLLSLKQ